jgi:nicotinate-nucleotide pyrophosphorylase (carboxylating)
MTNSKFLKGLEKTVKLALQEDIGDADLTAQLIAADTVSHAQIILREDAIICGLPWFNEVFRQIDSQIIIDWSIGEGSPQTADTVICTLSGRARQLLTGERTALNFLQLLSGTATITSQYVNALHGTSCKILDTRKTIPGLRLAQKYAVACGGGKNHRLGLYDQILIKENHIEAAGSIAQAVKTAQTLHPGITIEVETETLAQLEEALKTNADILMLDNYSIKDMHQAVNQNKGRKKLEVSGNVTLEKLPVIATTGVDFISSGALTKDVSSIDLSMLLSKTRPQIL